MTKADYLRSLRNKAVEAGLCYQCRCRKPRPGIKNCDHCMDRTHKAHDRLRYIKCQRCFCDLPAGHAVQICDACRPIVAAQETRSRNDVIARGICGRCRKRPLTSDTHCQECLDDIRDERIAWGRMVGAKPRPCGICGIPGHNRRTHDRYVERAKEWAP